MGLVRRLLERGLERMEHTAERSQQAHLAKLTPAERERYDQWTARTEALRSGTPVEDLPDHRLMATVLQGPAGEAVHGVRAWPRTPAAIEDPAVWDERRRTERAERVARRAPYLAEDRSPVAVTRLLTRGDRQVDGVATHLAATGLAARPDLVYGVFPVPDLLTSGRLGFGGERRGVVEWAVVHAATGALPASMPPAVLRLDAAARLVDRAVTAPAPLDEDLALDVLRRAGIGPEHTIGIARDVRIAHRDRDEGWSTIDAEVRGVHVLVADAVADALRAASAGAPWRIAAGPPEGVVVDVLQWDAIARAVHPVRQHRPPLPSPFPYLPLTAEELLCAYLDVVGVAPADAYAAQITHDRRFDLMSRSSASSHVRRTGGGPALPCADGVARRRMVGGHHVVLAYRDRPVYAAGRERFDAYAGTELHAHLRRGLDLRRPVPAPAGRLERAFDRIGTVAEVLTGEYASDESFVPPRYCWPPSRG